MRDVAPDAQHEPLRAEPRAAAEHGRGRQAAGAPGRFAKAESPHWPFTGSPGKRRSLQALPGRPVRPTAPAHPSACPAAPSNAVPGTPRHRSARARTLLSLHLLPPCAPFLSPSMHSEAL